MVKTRSLTTTQAYEFYLLDAQARLATLATIRTYGDRIPPFVNWCKPQKITALTDINPDTVRRYFVHLAERKFSDITIMGVGRCLRAWFNFCVRES